MQNIETFDFQDKKALIRVDFNVPLNTNFEVTDTTRIIAAVPTIKKVLAGGGSVILMSHLGRPKGEKQNKFSLKHIVAAVSEKIGIPVKFAEDCAGSVAVEAANNIKNGEVLLLENLRFHDEETEGDAAFARKLADLGDVYINDAFGTAHRAHASTAIVASFFKDKMFGYVIENELVAAQNVVEKGERPFTAIMGGAKISDKILLIEKLLDKVDNLIIGGGMSYTFFKALGGEVGASLVESDKLKLARTILELAKEKNVNLCLPTDSIVASEFSNEASISSSENTSIPKGWMGLDIGAKAIEDFFAIIKKSKTIMWNGPMGVFEMSNFENGTKLVAQAIVEATENGAYSLIGGGDSAAAINKFNYQDKVSYISTGGGALLEYLEGKDLPGLKAIRN
ncbi:phosphoglycerate kinase [Vicingaceae bacterium]|nr:phosphoglycerate kinase [Vicingaceae bacterium]MDB4061347.1 phosphoglycerate kinase [Vicingaceae bacterium]MDC1451948.1 phosphoglycerate kinase [Vicingaceae bacterium]